MARYVEDNRYTELFVTGSLETLLPRNAMARTIRAALDRLDFSDFDAPYSNDESGRPALNPRSLTAVWILALMRGVTSSVRLAVLCAEDIEFRFLLGDAGVEKSTLCDFRKAHLAQTKRTVLCPTWRRTAPITTRANSCNSSSKASRASCRKTAM